MTVNIQSCPDTPLSVTFVSTNYDFQFDYDASSNLLYLGKAVIGSLTSAVVWQIRKFTVDVSSNLISILWASGNDSFDKIWDNRTTYVYS